jgi:nucleotide-binding universal stress UspA family protein
MKAPCILVAVDFSEPATAAYLEAIELAAFADARLQLLYVAEGHDGEEAARMRQWLDDVEVEAEELITLPGTPWVQIVRHCESTQPLFLVVGSHGLGGYQTLGPGSTTARLLVRSPVPVLVVPQRPAIKRIDASINNASNRAKEPHA